MNPIFVKNEWAFILNEGPIILKAQAAFRTGSAEMSRRSRAASQGIQYH